MSAKYAVLGLVIERPGYGYQLALRLHERFGSSAFAPSGVYSALDQLTREQLVRPHGRNGAVPVRRASPRVTYEATGAGVDHFERWMLGSSPAPPLRDELHMKIALCRPRDVPRLIDTVYGQELACSARMRELERARDHARADHLDDARMMRALARDAEIALWRARIGWLESARELLLGLRARPPRTAAGGGRALELADRRGLRAV